MHWIGINLKCGSRAYTSYTYFRCPVCCNSGFPRSQSSRTQSSIPLVSLIFERFFECAVECAIKLHFLDALRASVALLGRLHYLHVDSLLYTCEEHLRLSAAHLNFVICVTRRNATATENQHIFKFRVSQDELGCFSMLLCQFLLRAAYSTIQWWVAC